MIKQLQQRWRALIVMVIAASVAIALASCTEANLRSSAARVPEIIIANPSDPSTFNAPLNDSLFSTYVFGLIQEGMLKTNGLTGALEPELAESWQIAPDQKAITFKLRPDLRWSDGEPLTVDDVVFTFNQIYLNTDIPTGIRDILQTGDGSYPKVEKIDNQRLKISVTQPYAPLLRNSGVAILPQHVFAEAVRDRDADGNLKFLTLWGTDTPPDQIITNGPYIIDSYTPGQRLVFKANPHYWHKDETGADLPRIQRIIMQIIESDTNQMIRFRSGELDNMNVKPEAFPLLKQEEKRGGFTIYNGGPELGSRNLSFNLNKAKGADGKPFVDPVKSRWFNTQKFRQAVAYGLDRQRMQDNIYRGIGSVQDAAIDVQSPFHAGVAEGVPAYNYDPAKAKQLLSEAGFQLKDNGKGATELYDDQGNRVEFSLLVKSEEKSRVDMATQIAQDLTALGMQANLQVVNFNTVLQNLKARRWDAYVGGFGGGGVEPHSSFNIWNSQGSLHQFNQGPEPGEQGITGWEVSDWEKRIDAAFAAGVQQLDDEKRKPFYREFQKIAQEQLPFIYLVKPLTLEAVRDRVQGIQYSALGGAFWNLDELTVENN